MLMTLLFKQEPPPTYCLTENTFFVGVAFFGGHGFVLSEQGGTGHS